MPLLPPGRRPAERDALEDVAVVADHSGLADHDAHAVVDEKAVADRGAGVDLDAGQKAPEVRDEPWDERDVGLPQRVSRAMDQQRVHAGIGEQYLGRRACGGVAVAGRLDVLADTCEPVHRGVLVMRVYRMARSAEVGLANRDGGGRRLARSASPWTRARTRAVVRRAQRERAVWSVSLKPVREHHAAMVPRPRSAQRPSRRLRRPPLLRPGLRSSWPSR